MPKKVREDPSTVEYGERNAKENKKDISRKANI